MDGHEKLRAPQIDGDVAEIEYDPFDEKVLYAATTDGLHRTFDAGLNWDRVEINIATADNRINRLAVHQEQEGVLFAPLADNRVVRSNDRGDSWAAIQGTDELPESPWTRGLVVERTTDQIGYIAVGDGVYEFGDGPVREVTSGLPRLDFLGWADLSISADDEHLYFIGRRATVSDESPPSGKNADLFRYDAGSDEAYELDIPDNPSSIASHPSDSSILYLGGWSWIYESRDTGTSWVALSNDFTDRYLSAVGVNHSHPGTVVPGSICSSGVWVSRDQGETYAWKRSGVPPFDGENHHGNYWEQHYVMHVAAGGDQVYVTTAGGLLISQDNGKTWRLENDVPGYDEHSLDHFHGLAVDPNDPRIVYIGTGLGRHGSTYLGVPPGVDEPSRLWKSEDAGQTWNEITEGFPTDRITVIQDILVSHHDSDVVYVGTNAEDYIAAGRGKHGGTGLGVYRSTNAGRRWNPLSTPFSNIHNLDQGADNPETIYASTPLGVFRSNDSGGAWERVLEYPSKGLVTHPEVSGLVFAGAQKYDDYWDLIVSEDNGDTWAEGDLTIQVGREPDEREYDGIDYNADYKSGGGGDLIDLAIDDELSQLVAATRGAGLWRGDISSLMG